MYFFLIHVGTTKVQSKTGLQHLVAFSYWVANLLRNKYTTTQEYLSIDIFWSHFFSALHYLTSTGGRQPRQTDSPACCGATHNHPPTRADTLDRHSRTHPVTNWGSRAYFWGGSAHFSRRSAGMLLVWPGGGPVVSDCANVTKLIAGLHHWDICEGNPRGNVTNWCDWSPAISHQSFFVSVCSSINVCMSPQTQCLQALV